MDPSMPGQLPASMKADTQTDVLGVIMAHVGNVFGSMHAGVEIALAGYPTDQAELVRLSLIAEERVRSVIAAELARIGQIEGTDTQISTEFGLLLCKALMEDLLPRIPSALARPAPATDGLFGDIGAGPASGFAPLPKDESEVDPDPAPDTTL